LVNRIPRAVRDRAMGARRHRLDGIPRLLRGDPNRRPLHPPHHHWGIQRLYSACPTRQ
jgi:hypothetical protein